jgi:hypothetical protein
VIDLLYVALTVGFFTAMLGYIRACERLGRRGERRSDR